MTLGPPQRALPVAKVADDNLIRRPTSASVGGEAASQGSRTRREQSPFHLLQIAANSFDLNPCCIATIARFSEGNSSNAAENKYGSH